MALYDTRRNTSRRSSTTSNNSKNVAKTSSNANSNTKQNEINTYELQKEINKYYNLRDQISSMINHYNSVISKLELVVANFNSSYSVDDSSVGKEESIRQKNIIVENRNLLRDRVIPAIDYQITNIRRQMQG